MRVNCVKRLAHDFAPLQHVEICVVRNNISEPFVPFGLLEPPHLFAVDLADNLDGLIGKRSGRRYLAQRAGHHNSEQLIAQAVLVVGAALFGNPCQVAP